MGRGRPIDQSQWPDDRPRRTFFELLDKVHRDHGTKSLSLIAEGMSLRARSRVSTLLRGELPADENQVRDLICALGGSAGDIERGLMLYRTICSPAAKASRLGSDVAAKRKARARANRTRSRFRTGYLEQVRLIVPPRGLLGRETELAQLAEFCTSDQGGAYQWWRGDAWAGKSALLSWFVLHPPPNVEIVSFFITARFMGHDNRAGFVDVLLEQLAALLGQDLPGFLPPAVREGHLLQMLSEAGKACQAAGARLILVVDGLDEDSGVTAGHDTHSIGALLPRTTEFGLRIVVASRADPPIPGDVPDGHPMRDPEAIRDLSRSEYAAVVRDNAERGLRRILHGMPIEQDLLGLVAAAGGGLAIADLAELTDQSEYEIRSLLHSITGRVFASRTNQWYPGIVYVFAHTELQAAAIDALGAKRLVSYRHRVKAWAEAYRSMSWPESTPEYLLRGYFEMLHACGDTVGVIECALDRARHDRMLSMSGGDTAALTEIAAAQNTVLAQHVPDLGALACLARCHDELAARNAWIPARLPAVWARLGEPARAEALAFSSADPVRQAEALAQVAGALAAAGDFSRAEKLARSIPRAPQQAEALAQVAGALAAAGDFSRAEKLARSIPRAPQQAEALAQVAGALAAAGDFSRAEKLAPSIPGAPYQAEALAHLAGALAAASDFDRAEKLARSIPRAPQQAEALAHLAGALAAASDFDRAEKLALTISDQHWQAQALGNLAVISVTACPPYRAEMLAYAVTDPFWRTRILIRVARALAAAEEHDRAEALTRSYRTRSGMPRH